MLTTYTTVAAPVNTNPQQVSVLKNLLPKG
jgi:hypothetical protein